MCKISNKEHYDYSTINSWIIYVYLTVNITVKIISWLYVVVYDIMDIKTNTLRFLVFLYYVYNGRYL